MQNRKKHAKTKRGYLQESSTYLNQTEILGGKGCIYTTPDSNGNWYFRTYIAEAKKYLRKGLRTKIKDDAIKKGENLMIDIMAKHEQGHKIFGLSFREVCEAFLTESSDRVKAKKITAGRLDTLKTQVHKWIVPYFDSLEDGHKIMCSALDRNSAFDYGMYRRKNTEFQAQDVTIRNEFTTINSICRFAYRKGWLPFEKFNVEEIKIKEPARRDTFTIEEYRVFYQRMRKWVKESEDKHELYMRSLMRDFILVKANSFLRFGEIYQLKWHMCKTYSYKKEKLMELNLPSTICKNRKSRTVLTNGGQYLDRFKALSEHTEPDDYVWTSKEGKHLSKPVLYKYWTNLLKTTGMDNLRNPKGGTKKLTYYALRHLGITFRLMSNVGIYEVATLAGTDVTFIERHYSHMDIKRMKNTALKTFRTSPDGAVIPIMQDDRFKADEDLIR